MKKDPVYAELFRKPCITPVDRRMSGYDWRLSYYDSFRAYSCGPTAGQTKTIFWSHIDIAPVSAPQFLDSGTYNRRVWALVGTIAIAQDGSVARVFDIFERREIGQITTSSASAIQAVHVIAGEGLVLIESLDNPNDGYQRNLRAYSFK